MDVLQRIDPDSDPDPHTHTGAHTPASTLAFAHKDTKIWTDGGAGGGGSVLVACSCVGWLLACIMSQQHASVCQGRICSDNCACCHTEIEVADQTFYLTVSVEDTGRPVPPQTL